MDAKRADFSQHLYKFRVKDKNCLLFGSESAKATLVCQAHCLYKMLRRVPLCWQLLFTHSCLINALSSLSDFGESVLRPNEESYTRCLHLKSKEIDLDTIAQRVSRLFDMPSRASVVQRKISASSSKKPAWLLGGPRTWNERDILSAQIRCFSHCDQSICRTH